MRKNLPLCLLTLILPTLAHGQDVPALDIPFEPGSEDQWTIERRFPDSPTLTFAEEGQDPGLRFQPRDGLCKLTRQWPVGSQPFEVMADVIVKRGNLASWRNKGMVIALSSAAVEEMTQEDFAVVFATVQQGVIATVRRGGARWGVKREGGKHTEFPGKDIAPRFQLTMGGFGGHEYSIPWPLIRINDTTLRYHVWRDAEHMMRLTVYNADGDAAPWWTAEAELPGDLRDKPLKYLTVFTGQEHNMYAPGRKIKHRARMDGLLHEIRAQPLEPGERPQYNQPFDASVVPDPEGWTPEPTMVSDQTLEQLREKFNRPMFEHYKAGLLRQANSRKDPGRKPLDGEVLIAQVWAYKLTGEQDFLDRAIKRVDNLVTATDRLPSRRKQWPGSRKQFLNIRQFNSHDMATLAVAYDLLGEELGPERRARTRYVLDRAMRYYYKQVKGNDWWFAGNPSNTIGVGNGAMGLIAVALRDEQPEFANEVIKTAAHEIQNTFKAIRPDGSCVEGNMYWNYGMAYPILLGWTLRQATGDDRGLLTSERLKNGYQYLGINLGGNNQNIPFNDTMPWLQSWLVCAHTGSEFDQPLMRWMADHIAAELAQNPPPWREQDRGTFAVTAFLTRDTTPAPDQFPGVPDVAALSGVQEGVMRSDGSQYIPGLVTGVKGMGKISTHHTNQDQGSFVLYANGEMLLFDAGYNEPNARSHSLILLGEKAGLKAKAEAPIEDVWSEGPLRSMVVDATDAHKQGKGSMTGKIQHVRRVFVQADDEALVTLDDVAVEGDQSPVTVYFQSMWPAEADGGKAMVIAENTRLAIHTFGPELKISVKPRELNRWVYKYEPVQWHTITGEGAFDANRPLVSVMLPAKGDATLGQPAVDYAAGKVTVKLPSGQRVAFAKDEQGRWNAVKSIPTDP